MKKKLLSFLFLFVCIFSFTSACSKNDIERIELVEDSIKTEYMIFEDLDINDLEIKISFNDSEKIYTIDQSMFTIGQVDNTVAGEQLLSILVEYKGYEKRFTVSLNFYLPQDITAIIDKIDALPEKENLDFNYITTLNSIQDEFLSLEDKYKTYVSNYNELESKIEYLQRKKEEVITPDVLCQRYVYVGILDKLISSLDMNSYTDTGKEEITIHYNNGIVMLNDDNNYNVMNEIVYQTRKKILEVKTRDELSLIEYKEQTISKLIAYKNSFDRNLYSQDNVVEFENILFEGIDSLDKSNDKDTINSIFETYCENLDNIVTIEEEKIIKFNNLVSSKIYETSEYYFNINLSKYDTEGRESLNEYLDKYQNLIKQAKNEEEMDNYIYDLKKILSSIPTLEEKEMSLLNEYRNNAINRIESIYLSINIYNYSSQNRIEIENILLKAKESIALSNDYEVIDSLIEDIPNKINGLLTIEDELKIILDTRINEYINVIETLLSSFSASDYSSGNWNDILSIIEEAKQYIRSISLQTSDETIVSNLNKKYLQIDNILTLQEENQLLIENTRNESIKTIDEYYSNLNKADYTENEWAFITNKITNVISMIKQLEEVQSINRLTRDTINYVQLI